MNQQVTIANTVGFLSALFTLAGVSGITTGDVSGFVNVLVGLVTLVSFVWAHFAHKQAVAVAAATGSVGA